MSKNTEIEDRVFIEIKIGPEVVAKIATGLDENQWYQLSDKQQYYKKAIEDAELTVRAVKENDRPAD